MAATTFTPAFRQEMRRVNHNLQPLAPATPRGKQGRPSMSPRAAVDAKRAIPGQWAAMVHQLCASTGPGAAEIGKAMASVDRRVFAPASREQYAYVDVAHPIGHGATIEAPSVHARTTPSSSTWPA
jgi:hypothetical protein